MSDNNSVNYYFFTESVMNKKYIVRLSDEERRELVEVINKLKGTSQKVKRAQILLKADADGQNWPHYQIAEAFLCRTRTVSNVCKPPEGYSNWSLRLIAEKTVELGIVESISHTTVSTTLKKIK